MEGNRVPCHKPAGSLRSRDSEPCLCLAASPWTSLCGDSGDAHQCELMLLGSGDSERLGHQAAGLAPGTHPWSSLGYHEAPGVVRIRTQAQVGGDDGDSRSSSGGLSHSCP